eukprot:CAMPEP_0174259654 /NCGR_PEP_ID=MMETSP0439-20130205/8458_1 /TAXON_ID=0 /ORGANISM="Stereomyxa ramosa, Strain Chinc5" /LENGTH=89 /DNA_ID=CAMNT_0015343629 /DNA_START=22 /DNA_END=288 /DNA_ORIENTATION=-
MSFRQALFSAGRRSTWIRPSYRQARIRGDHAPEYGKDGYPLGQKYGSNIPWNTDGGAATGFAIFGFFITGCVAPWILVSYSKYSLEHRR